MGARMIPSDLRTTDAEVTQRRRYASVPPKGVRLTHRFLCAVADWRMTAANLSADKGR
jgi:hypothetical protein